MINFYKPNPKVSGAACSFYMNDKGEFFGTFIKQASWDEKRRQGKFDQNKKAIIKFSAKEFGDFINAILRKGKAEGYHQSAKQVVGFALSASTGEYAGSYTWSATVTAKDDSTNKLSFFVTLDGGEAMLLLEHLRYLLQGHWKINDSEYHNKFEKEVPTTNGPKTQPDDDTEW